MPPGIALIAPSRGRVADFPITDEEFLKFRDFYYRINAVQFAEKNRYFVDRRIAERARSKGCATFREYFIELRLDRTGLELRELINVLAVHDTCFFSENEQLEALNRVVLPEIAKHKRRAGDTITIWSLPCSTGEEPYSIAISVLDGWPQQDKYEIEIQASDIDARVLSQAEAGVYSERSLLKVTPDQRARYFRQVGVDYQIMPALRESIEFSELNISSETEMAGHRNIDVIFCCNFLISLDDVSRREAVEAIFDSLTPGGFVFLGQSESMSRMSSLFMSRRLGNTTVYQRPQGRAYIPVPGFSHLA